MSTLEAPRFLSSPFFPSSVPEPDPSHHLVRGFYEACADGRLVVQQCLDCDSIQHPPEVICHNCLGFRTGWKEVSGLGQVFSWTKVVNPPLAGLRDAVPYYVVLVQMDDVPDFYLTGILIDGAEDDVIIGLPVEVVFERLSPDVVLPRWRRRTANAAP